MHRPTLTFPSWLPGVCLYASLLILNSILILFAMLVLDGVATALEMALVVCNSLSSTIIIGVLFSKMITRTWVFNDIKFDRVVFIIVTILDVVVAIGWALRLDRKGFCGQLSDGTTSCHGVLITSAVALSWVTALVANAGAVLSDHRPGGKASTLPVHVDRRAISDPVMIHAGQFSSGAESDEDKFKGFTEIPLRQDRLQRT